MMAKRKKYTEEFKREAVRLLLSRGEQSAASVAKGLGIAESMLYQWAKKHGDVAKAAVNSRGETTDEELVRLRREVNQLRKEKEILKKSALLLLRDNDR